MREPKVSGLLEEGVHVVHEDVGVALEAAAGTGEDLAAANLQMHFAVARRITAYTGGSPSAPCSPPGHSKPSTFSK